MFVSWGIRKKYVSILRLTNAALPPYPFSGPEKGRSSCIPGFTVAFTLFELYVFGEQRGELCFRPYCGYMVICLSADYAVALRNALA